MSNSDARANDVSPAVGVDRFENCGRRFFENFNIGLRRVAAIDGDSIGGDGCNKNLGEGVSGVGVVGSDVVEDGFADKI